MDNLIEELGSEDKDNYVYLDSEGKVEKKHEFIIKWNRLPNKPILLTVNLEYK